MKALLKFLQVLYSIYALLLFAAILIIIFPLVLIASLFGKVNGGNFIYMLCGLWGDIWLPMIGIFHRNVFVAPHSKDHACIFVVNHISYMDIPILVKALRQPLRVLGKMELSKVPVFGYLYKEVVVMVDRTNNENRASSVKALKSVINRGTSIVIFPEGTFNETGQPLKQFYNGAFKIAIETQTPIKPVVFADTVRRLHYNSIFSLTPGVSRAVFLEEIPVKGLGMADIDMLKNKVYERMWTELKKWGEYQETETVAETTNIHS